MKIAIAVKHDVIAPALPGVDLWVLSLPGDTEKKMIIDTSKWPLVEWGKKLLNHDVELLITTGLDQFVWGMLKGHGIEVVPNFIGKPRDALEQLASGSLLVPRLWPPDNSSEV